MYFRTEKFVVTFICGLLQVILSMMWAYIGAAYLHDFCDSSRGRTVTRGSRSLLCGMALHVASICIGLLGAGRIVYGLQSKAGEWMPVILWAFLLGMLWLGALLMGLKRTPLQAPVRRIVPVAVCVMVLLLALHNGGLEGADWFLLAGLSVWLAVKLMSHRVAK